VTPRPDASLLTVAVREAEPPAATEVESAATMTVIGKRVARELLPHPASTVANPNASNVKARDALRFITTSARFDLFRWA
jgi:hypothetical protein